VKRKIKLSKLIAQNKLEVFKQIAEFENYVNFVPGCSRAKLIEKTDEYEIGELDLNFFLKNYSLRSKNVIKDDCIEINQLKGPFESFIGEWLVEESNNNYTKVTFKAEFRLPFILNTFLSDQMIANFCEQAIANFFQKIKN
tara:strand:- start:20248 stop:20670 length:423 start_codon:yes stop_codon:yes gene_type:complete